MVFNPRIELGFPQPKCGVLTTIFSYRVLFINITKYIYIFYTRYYFLFCWMTLRGLVGTTYAHEVGICELESRQEYIFF